MVPVNLVHAIADVGFDFGMTEREVAEPCPQCHLVESAAIICVQKAQSVVRRARFDHRPHVMLRGCVPRQLLLPLSDNYFGRLRGAGVDIVNGHSTFPHLRSSKNPPPLGESIIDIGACGRSWAVQAAVGARSRAFVRPWRRQRP